MKKKIFTPFRSVALLFAGCFLMCSSASAQSFDIALTTQDAGLVLGTATDLSGFYTIQYPTGDYMTTDAGCESLIGATNQDIKYVIELEKLADGKYYIKAGDAKANYATNGWNIVFDNIATTNNEWIINLTADNTITIQKDATHWTKCEYARGRDRIYSDGGSIDNAAAFMLEKVVTKRTVALPAAGTYSPTAVTLTAGADLSGKYVIYDATGGYMTANVSDRAAGEEYSLLSSVDPQYAFDLMKQTDGTYTISIGDFQAVHPDPNKGGVSFEYMPQTSNTWTIDVVDATTVTIKTDDGASYLKNALNSVYKYFSNGNATDNVNFTLLRVPSTAVKSVFENIKSNVYSSASQLIVTKTDNVKTIAIYNVNGQKVYGASVNSGELSIPVKSWSKGVYLVRLTDNEGGFKNIKTSLN